MSSITIHKGNDTTEYSFEPGSNLMELLRAAGLGISAPCGGHGLCGKCSVLLRKADECLEVNACGTVLTDDCEVFLPETESEILWNRAEASVRAESGFSGLGAAVDLGTTTVAVSLYELGSGRELGSLSRWNAQKAYGADVISRIGHCMGNDDVLVKMRELIRGQILDMLTRICAGAGKDPAGIKLGFLAGNTVMEHIFAGIPPDGIASAPYLPASYFDSGEKILVGEIPFYLSPCIAGYVGGDISAGILASGIGISGKKVLFIDAGTNGEIVLGDKNGFFCCAVASGPAFEGAGISCGMPAADGAICSVEIKGDGLEYQVIGGGEARGICGSGLLDLAACLLELGYIDESGCLEDDSGNDVFYITDDVYLSQRDVRCLQLAKAALSAGITRLTEISGTGMDEISEICLAGGFGTRLRSESAVRIGMLPESPADRIKAIGNTSLNGAAIALLNPSERGKLIEIKEKCRYLELSSDSRFNELFVEAMSFPEQ